MKYLEITTLDHINAVLSSLERTGDCRLVGRVEAYSCALAPLSRVLAPRTRPGAYDLRGQVCVCVGVAGRGLSGKAAGDDKKLYKILENKYSEDHDEHDMLSTASPFGPLAQHASRKTLYYLIATLNASFTDYDFRCVSQLTDRALSLGATCDGTNDAGRADTRGWPLTPAMPRPSSLQSSRWPWRSAISPCRSTRPAPSRPTLPTGCGRPSTASST